MRLKKGQVFTFSLKGRKNLVTGTIVNSSNYWILLKYIPIDYVIDGYMLIQKKFVRGYWRKDDEKFKEAVLKAKKIDFSDSINLPIGSLTGAMKRLHKEHTLIQFDLADESICYVGKITKIMNGSFIFKKMSTRGAWVEESEYKAESVWTLQFSNDYLVSLSAYAEDR